MSITKEQAVNTIQHCINALHHVNARDNYYAWTKNTLVLLVRIYGEESYHFREFACTSSSQGYDYEDSWKAPVKTFLEGFLSEIDLLGLPARTENNGNVQNQVNVHQAQQQSQQQSQSIEQAIQELRPELIAQIQQIIKEGDSKTTIADRIWNILEDVGKGTAASVLASILMNHWS